MGKRWFSIKAEGVLSLSGDKWVKVIDRDQVAYVRLSDCVARSSAIAKLLDQGVTVTSAAKASHLFEEIDEIRTYKPDVLIDHSGWNGGHFALPDGTVFSPDGESAVVVFDVERNKCAATGTLTDWKEGVACPLTGQVIPMFCVMLALMPPLLRLSERAWNFGFELVGRPGTGKTTVQLLASSVLGGIGRGGDDAYWTTFNATLNSLEAQMAAHSDLVMIIEEANLFLAGETAAKRASSFKAFAFKIGGGTSKGRFGAPTERTHRLSFLSSSNESLATLIGQDSDVAAAAADRLITLNLTQNGKLGVFSSLPDGQDSTSSFVAALISAASSNHGQAIRKFLSRLVAARTEDEEKLKSTINKLVRQFTGKACADPDDGSMMRVAEGFGLVYAAGILGKRYGVLPKSWKCGPAVLSCYRDFRTGGAVARTFDELLEDVASSPDALHLGRDHNRASSKQISRAEVIVRHKPGLREIMIRPEHLAKHLPAWRALRRRPDAMVRLQKEKGHDAIKRKLHKKLPATRFYCFILPASDDG